MPQGWLRWPTRQLPSLLCKASHLPHHSRTCRHDAQQHDISYFQTGLRCQIQQKGGAKRVPSTNCLRQLLRPTAASLRTAAPRGAQRGACDSIRLRSNGRTPFPRRVCMRAHSSPDPQDGHECLRGLSIQSWLDPGDALRVCVPVCRIRRRARGSATLCAEYHCKPVLDAIADRTLCQLSGAKATCCRAQCVAMSAPMNVLMSKGLGQTSGLVSLHCGAKVRAAPACSPAQIVRQTSAIVTSRCAGQLCAYAKPSFIPCNA